MGVWGVQPRKLHPAGGESLLLTVPATVLAEVGLEELCWSGESGEAVTSEGVGVDDGERWSEAGGGA